MRVDQLTTLALLICCLILVLPAQAGHLHSAAYRGDWAAARQLLEAGADVNERDTTGVAPIHYAAQMGHADVIEILILRGADVGIGTTKDGNTALHLASGSGQNDAVTLLLGNGADIDRGNNDAQTPLHWAVENGRVETVEVLTAGGADIEATDSHGLTPLHRGVLSGYSTIVDILLDLGADPDARDAEGRSPLASALKQGYTRIARVLRLAGAGIETDRDLRRFVQNQLCLRGYGISEVDGIMGPNTVAAIGRYQRHAGLDEDGLVSEDLVDHLASSGEIDPYLSGDGDTVTNIFVSWFDLAYDYGWEPGFLWSQAELVGEGASGMDPDFPGAMKYSGHVRFEDLEIYGTVWVVANGWVIAHGSRVLLRCREEGTTDRQRVGPEANPD